MATLTKDPMQQACELCDTLYAHSHGPGMEPGFNPTQPKAEAKWEAEILIVQKPADDTKSGYKVEYDPYALIDFIRKTLAKARAERDKQWLECVPEKNNSPHNGDTYDYRIDAENKIRFQILENAKQKGLV